MFYNEKILKLFREPHYAGEFSANTPHVVTAQSGNPGQTDVVQLQLQIINNKIVAAKFKCSGSICTVASAEYLLGNIINKTIIEALSYTSQRIIADLQLPEQRINSALLVEDCLQKVLKNE
ncbi:MAG: iron-sulfur cluster assembly scaffold protein [Gammaproteobacteria bacterium]|nr:iron-sulfur cluster assembly scaffold protein [Gammaproteobacteria bacterium]